MAEVDNITTLETGEPSQEVSRCQLTGASSTYTSRRIGRVKMAFVDVEGTNSMTFTRSGNVVTITGTNDDWVNVLLIGDL